MKCVIKDDGKFYPKIFLEQALFVKYACKQEISMAFYRMVGLVHTKR